ncbi:MAG: hypothetical protein RLZZ124_13 [Cyanobacteriota bacterium]
MLEERSAPEYDNTILELRARVEALESKYETMRLATLEWGKDVDKLMCWSDQHLQRIMALEAAQQQPEPIDEEENDRRFHACMDLIRNATPEQIRAAAGLPERSSLLERVADAINSEAGSCFATIEARAAIGEVAATLKAQCFEHAANWLEQEADRG